MRVETLTSDATAIAMLHMRDGDAPAPDGDGRGELLDAARKQADELLMRHGAVVFRGLGIASASDFHDAVARFGEPFTEYLYGNSPRRSVHEGVWTSTDYPAEYDISLHNELSQAYRWPDRLFFCCLVAPPTGGETPVSDGRAMLARMDPGVRERFSRHGVAYLQNLHGGYGLGRSWQDSYETGDAAKVEEYLRVAGIEFRWTDDEDLRIRQVRPATRMHPATGEEVWFNQADQFHISSLRPSEAEALLALVSSAEELPLSATFGDGTQIPLDDLAHVRDVAAGNECVFCWMAGDILMIDNMLVMHGRHAYAGPRQVLVAMT
jgi:alpha-ketoglutarate-dependent taurine dioxygenase